MASHYGSTCFACMNTPFDMFLAADCAVRASGLSPAASTGHWCFLPCHMGTGAYLHQGPPRQSVIGAVALPRVWLCYLTCLSVTLSFAKFLCHSVSVGGVPSSLTQHRTQVQARCDAACNIMDSCSLLLMPAVGCKWHRARVCLTVSSIEGGLARVSSTPQF